MRFADRIYTEVNAEWPKELPALRPEEAVRAARRLWRFATGKTFRGEIKKTSGNRYTWIIRGIMVVNASRGWRDLVHDLSHCAHNRISDERPHSEEHAQLELKMVRWVVMNGWLDGRLQPPAKPKPTAIEKAKARLVALDLRTKRWETKAKRAATALRKLKCQRRALERRIQSQGEAK